jgi:hypothetical protein
MFGKSMNGLGHAGIPDKKFVVVAARGQVLVVGRPFETTYFLSMPNKSSFWKKEKHWLKLLYCSSFLDLSPLWHSIVSTQDFFFTFLFQFSVIFLNNMKILSEVAPGLLVIQIQAVCCLYMYTKYII